MNRSGLTIIFLQQFLLTIFLYTLTIANSVIHACSLMFENAIMLTYMRNTERNIVQLKKTKQIHSCLPKEMGVLITTRNRKVGIPQQ